MLNRDQIAHDFLLNSEKLLVKEAFDKADEFITEAQKRKNTERPAVVDDGWISVDDRLPESGDVVLVYDVDGGSVTNDKTECYKKCRFKKGKFWIEEEYDSWEIDGTTHWQALPNPPKGETE